MIPPAVATAEQLAVVNNKTKVTSAQIDEFLQLCWTKYVKAKIEPGELSLISPPRWRLADS